MPHQIDLTPLAPHGGGPIWQFALGRTRLTAFARGIQEEGGQLLALWGADDRHLGGTFTLHTAYLSVLGLIWAKTPLEAHAPSYPDIAHIFPQAGRMQRATRDLLGLIAENADDTRKWLRHAVWSDGQFPLRRDFELAQPEAADAYPFVRVEGQGVHEIPVGPIHAGVIEPGHFRFSVIGDRVLRMETRLGYTHKGIEKRFEGLDVSSGARLAGRVCGDSHSAFTWAFCMAVETALETTPPPRAQWLRALFLEIERLINHLGDLGYLGNDVALGFGFNQFWRIKETWLRACREWFGHRYLFDCIVPGGVARDLTASAAAEVVRLVRETREQVRPLIELYEEHAGVQDRFTGTGIVTPALAARLGLTGLAGRASSQAWDARVQFPWPPYQELDVQMALERSGDVAARARVRAAETLESLRLLKTIAESLPPGPLVRALPTSARVCEALGWVEGWRGPVIVHVRLQADGRLDRVHPHDPSWQNWPLLELAVLGNIVPDFPLINKSFNLSYSGADL
ncbi:NADH-quinone oxidoreductase subunit C [Thiobacter aerophilum]|uniref:NADH-quinone oxidoreductase subunit C n=1 Tax=Thiobacter aerophilum TaxID=3121275 RepID=A0ABV0EC30_9BURK